MVMLDCQRVFYLEPSLERFLQRFFFRSEACDGANHRQSPGMGFRRGTIDRLSRSIISPKPYQNFARTNVFIELVNL